MFEDQPRLFFMQRDYSLTLLHHILTHVSEWIQDKFGEMFRALSLIGTNLQALLKQILLEWESQGGSDGWGW